MSGHIVKSKSTGKAGCMSETRYAQVARDLTEGITNGRFQVGSLLPTELELGEH
jgi:DNA-binding GntR family transcriptional regulator